MPNFIVQKTSLTTGDPRRPLLRPGETVPEGMFSDETAGVLLKEGVLRLELSPAEEALRAQHEAHIRVESQKVVVTRMGDIKSDDEVEPGDVIPAPLGKWDLNPALLLGKSLDDLNVMVLERDGSAPLFETVEEASAQLSQDFRG